MDDTRRTWYLVVAEMWCDNCDDWHTVIERSFSSLDEARKLYIVTCAVFDHCEINGYAHIIESRNEIIRSYRDGRMVL